ncbi:MAG: hypothetical protein LAT64_00495 [Phycisphaerales bacterium]|nr:hypothetical protein [Planctomycetota bacterium]MCH8507240.1 hypothetical protein [Phycisphaerales bacterium]
MPDPNHESSLFETPAGVRVIPPERLLDDPERTVMLDPGDLEESEQLLMGFDPEASIRNTRLGDELESGAPDRRRTTRARTSWRGRRRKVARSMVGPGARFVYALGLMAVTLGVLGLAASWRNHEVMIVAGFFCGASAIFLWVFWRSWLDGFPYFYRLLTSLGEDAENLLHWRLWNRCGRLIRSLYR